MLVQSHYETDNRVRRKAEALVAEGFEVDVLALRSKFSPRRSYEVNGVHVETLSLGRNRGSVLRYAFEYAVFFVWAMLKVSARHERQRYDVIEANNLPDFLVFAAIWCRFRGARVVLDMHEITPEFYMSKYGIEERSVLVELLKRVELASVRFADAVITINEPIQRLLEGRGLEGAKSTIIMNAADATLFDRGDAVGPLAIDRPPGRFILMYHGTLTSVYGLDIAIEALALAHRRVPDVDLWILGDGPEKARLEQLTASLGIGERVRFLGAVLPDQVKHWLTACDVGVLPTRSDVFLDLSFPNKLSEYILMDKPVISSRLPTIRHYYADDALVYFAPGSAEALAEAMVAVRRLDAKERGHFQEAASRDLGPIRWEVMRGRYLDLMRKLIIPQREGSVARTQL